ncbi:MAG TPA: tetratricopeptide repeat protein, partial [Anaerolineae bacterium]
MNENWNELEPQSNEDQEEKRLKSWLKRGHERQFREQMITGTRLLQARKPQEALPLLKRAYELRPGDMDAALNLSSAYLMLGRFKLAVVVLEEAVGHHRDNPRLWINLGAA